MKQTNNAIKFLMAQYRAIFRNANLKMFLAAATAAAALSAGYANAGPINAGGFEKLTGDANKADDTSAITIAKEGAVTNPNQFTLTIEDGDTHSIDGVNDSNTAKPVTVTANSGSIVVEKKNGATKDPKLVIGAANGATVSLQSLTVKDGSIEVGAAANKTNGSTVAASNITIGKGEGAEAGIVNLFHKSTLGDDSSLISVKTGGKIEAAGEAANASVIAGALTIEGGKVVAAADSALEINKTVQINSGTLETAAKGSKIVLKNGATFADASIVHNGTLVIGGDTPVTLAKAHFSGAIGADAILELNNGTVALDMETLKALTAGANNKVAVTADAAGTLSFDGDVDLADGQVILVNAGTIGQKLNLNSTGTLTVKAANATFDKADTINAALSIEADTLTAGKADGTKLDINGDANISVKKALTVKSAAADTAALNIIKGKVNLNGVNGTSSTVTASTVTLKGADKDKAQFNINGGDWTVSGLEITSGDVSVARDASLIINGGKFVSAAAKANGVISANGGHIDAAKASEVKLQSAGVLELKNTATLTLDKSKILDQAGTSLDAAKFAKGSVVGDANTKLIIMDGDNKLKFEDDKAFTDFYNSTGFKGLFDVDFTPAVKSGEVAFTDLVAGLDNNSYSGVTATTDGATGVSAVYAVGTVKVTDNKDLSIKAGGALTLNGANGGDFVVKTPSAGKTETANVDFAAAGTSLTLKGAGNLGSVTATNNGEGALTIGDTGNDANNTKPVPGIVTVLKGNSIGTDASNRIAQVTVNEQSTLKVQSGSVFTNNLAVHDASTIQVSGDIVTNSAQVDGTLESTGVFSLTAAGENNFSSANVKVGTLKLASGVQVNIGNFDEAVPTNDATGSVYASSLELADGSVFIDPNSNMPYSVLAVNTLTGGVVGDVNAGTLTGKVNVGNNGVFGVGFKDKAALTGYLTKYTNQHGGLDPEQFSSALVLNKQITLAATDGIYVGKDAKANSASGNDLTIKSDAALVVSDDVFTVDGSGKKTGAAITMNSAGKANVADAKLVLIGDFSAADTALQIISGTTSITGKFNLASANGLLSGSEVDGSKGTYMLSFSRENANKLGAFADASAPVREILFKKLEGKIKGEGAGIELLADGATASLSGAVPDAAYHAATYAGAQQAAVAAVGTMAEAVGARVGSMGVEAATIAATGSQANGGVWLTPMYKSVDADGFNAEGASYGADVDLAGVAFGTDTVNGNMRFGAVFNIGSGDADGKGNGNGLKDEFDYYGFGIYSVMGFGNLALVGDASLNVISHDVKHDALGLTGSADTTAVTMGITGQYTIANPMVDVTPHLGARFIRLDTDSYDLKQAGEVLLNTDFDVQNVFSIPLGVSLSKAFEMGGWSLAPSADLSITFNTGDTEVKSSVTVPNTTGANASLTTEVLDEVTYGVAVGLGAQYGAFGTQIGINYTGSENTDAFGVNAQARYMF